MPIKDNCMLTSYDITGGTKLTTDMLRLWIGGGARGVALSTAAVAAGYVMPSK